MSNKEQFNHNIKKAKRQRIAENNIILWKDRTYTIYLNGQIQTKQLYKP